MRNGVGGSPGATLSLLRIRAGLSVRELSARAGVSASSVYRLERGGTARREVRDALVKVLGPAAHKAIVVKHDWPRTPLYLARLEQGMSEREAARAAGVTKEQYGRAERGQRVKPASVVRIARAFDLEVEDLLDGVT
jgi:transcriptional regulator with XRE-family HTH domain